MHCLICMIINRRWKWWHFPQMIDADYTVLVWLPHFCLIHLIRFWFNLIFFLAFPFCFWVFFERNCHFSFNRELSSLVLLVDLRWLYSVAKLNNCDEVGIDDTFPKWSTLIILCWCIYHIPSDPSSSIFFQLNFPCLIVFRFIEFHRI